MLPPETPANLKSFDGVMKIQLPMGEGGSALMYAEGRAWMLFVPVTPGLVEFVQADKMWGGIKTYALASLRPAKRTVQLKGIVAGHVW